ncbi:carbohydrate-binding protein [Pontiellaceae bacterium B12227]|nr:carbohydrate-binding protein [Pontiellaceae bacterium B12227]
MKNAWLIISFVSGVMTSPALANWFTNDLTSAAAVASDFDAYISSHANSDWSYMASSATDQNGAPNTELTGGAVLDWVTNDDDTARSYLGTIDSDWLGKSWTAHVAVEAPSSTKPYIFFGLGDPTPNESANNEPKNGNSTYVYWRSGQSSSKVSVLRNGSVATNTGAWQGDPGYDIYMTYNHIDKTVQFKIDNWNGGRFSGVNVDTGPIDVDGYFSDTNDVHIFFGANAKVTFGDFWVEDPFECVHPGIPLTVEDLDAVKANLNVEPWKTGYEALASDGYSSTNFVMNGPYEIVSHSKPGVPDTNGNQWAADMRAMHNLARMWYFTDNDDYAQKSYDILMDYVAVHTNFADGETYLEMGYNAWRVFEGADILRGTWAGWSEADTDACKTYFEEVWWNTGHIPTPGPLRSANQGAANLAAAVGVAIFNDDKVKFNQCLQEFRAGPAGALMDSLCNGQLGDSGRDSHSHGQLQLLAWIAEAFWKQGVDVYAEHDNRLLAAGEYYSRVAMGFDTPFVTAGTVYDIYPDNNSLAATNATYFHGPGSFNMLHGAYVLRKGMSSPYLEEYLSCFEQDAYSFHYLKATDTSTATIPPALTQSAPAASVTSLSGVNMGDCTSGGESYSSGTWTVSGRGSRLYYSSDPDYRFAYLPVTGDATIIAQLTGISGGSSSDARAGLVFNESISNNDTMAAVVITAEDTDDELQTWYRGQSASSHSADVHGKPNQPKQRMPYWLKIERIGDRVTLFTSPDGASWSTSGVADYDGLADTAYFGLAVSSDQYNSTATATFTDVRITGGDGGEASTVPEAPFAIYASPGGTNVPLRWLESFEADSYKIWRSTVSGGPYTLLTQESGTSFVDTNVVNGIRYYYAVSAVNAIGESAKSPEDTFHYRPNVIEAEDYNGRGGNARAVGGCSDWCGGDKVGYISNGEWTKYDNIQIGTGSVFRVRVAMGNTNVTGKIEVRLDSSTGTLIGSVDVPYTGSSDNNWNTLETAVSAVSGTHTLYLKYVETTASGVTGGGLFDVNWFDIVSSHITEVDLGMDTTITVDQDQHELTNLGNITAWDSTSTHLKLADGSDLSTLDLTQLGVTSWSTLDFYGVAKTTVWGGADLNGITLYTDGNFGAGDDFSGADFSNIVWGNAISIADISKFFSGGSGATSATDKNDAIDLSGADLSLITGTARTIMINNLGGVVGTTAIGAKFDPAFIAKSGWNKAALIAAGWQYSAVDAFSIIEGEDYDDQDGIDTQPCSEGGLNVQAIRNGDWCAYYNVDFSNGANGFQARVASDTSGGNIEIRLGSPTGTLAGTCTVSGTGNWQSWTTVSTSVSGVSGVHDVYLVFTGGSGYLFNVNWFIFTDATPPAAPAGLASRTGDGSISLDWANNGESDLAGYSIYRSVTSGSYGTPLATGINQSDYVDNDVTNGTMYYYVVTATDSRSNESAVSNQDSATPLSDEDYIAAFSADGLGVSNGNFIAQFAAIVGAEYTVEYSTNLTIPGSWMPLTNINPLEGSPFTLSVPSTNEATFFRVLWNP